MIEYKPARSTEEYLRYEEGRRFVKRYLSGLGRPRKAVAISGGEMVVAFDAAGALSLVPILIELAAGSLKDHTLHQVEQFEDSEGWWGDLEPGSVDLVLERDGNPVVFRAKFDYDPPPFRRGRLPEVEPDAQVSANVENTESAFVHFFSNAPGFVYFAKLMIYLAQPEVTPGLRVPLGTSSRSAGATHRLILQRADFSKTVPWAKPPSVKG